MGVSPCQCIGIILLSYVFRQYVGCCRPVHIALVDFPFIIRSAQRKNDCAGCKKAKYRFNLALAFILDSLEVPKAQDIIRNVRVYHKFSDAIPKVFSLVIIQIPVYSVFEIALDKLSAARFCFSTNSFRNINRSMKHRCRAVAFYRFHVFEILIFLNKRK